LTVNYPATTNQCQQAIDAAQFASSQGTTVYTIAYGASNVGGNRGSCATDTSGPLASLNACQALKLMATSPADFYSDANSSQNPGECLSSSNPDLSLNQIFKSVATSFTVTRLVPNSYFN